MIILIRKSNIILVGLAFILFIAILSLNLGYRGIPAVKEKLQAKTVVLDAGHGGEDPGKVSNYSDLKEKDINLSIAFKTKEILEKEEFNVIMTREEDRLFYDEGTTEIYYKRKQDLERRKKIMDENSDGIVVSIHANSFQETQYYGAQTFYPPNSEESKRLAHLLQKSLRENIDPNNKREPQLKTDQIVILRNLKTPTVIVECGFISNREEEAKLRTEEYHEKLAQAIAEGIKNYFNE
jgi:N-acetylmuramoyl-L-alanine amidase